MAKLNREEIKQRLEALQNPWKCAAFAAKVAGFALPGLAEGAKEKGFLYFWEENKRQQYLFASLRAWQLAWAAALLKNKDAAYAAYAAARPADAAYAAARTADAAYAAARTADAAYAAARAADAADAAYAAYAYADAAAVVAARAAARATPWLAEEVHDYIYFLYKNHNVSMFLCEAFKLPAQALSAQKNFLSELRKFGDDFDYWADWYEARMRGEPLDEELALKTCLLSDEILAQSPAEINAYLKSLQSAALSPDSQRPLNRVRAIFIGFGAAGKTSLIRRLNQETVIKGEEEMTPGIEISDWSVPDVSGEHGAKGLIAHLWDFGGQVMAHATHQFFLRSRCLYVVVLDARTEINADEQAEYWLEHVRAFGGDAPILLVGNKADQAQLNLNMSYLQSKYKTIVGFYPLSCTEQDAEPYRSQYQLFRHVFIEQLHALGMHQTLFNPPHFAVLEHIRKLSQEKIFLAKSAFAELCEQQGVAAEGGLNQDWLLDLLDKLGVIIHFPNLPFLGKYLLNPRWLTYGVYTLLYAQKSRFRQGRLDAQTMLDILTAEPVETDDGRKLYYQAEHCQFILNALEKFEIGFALPGDCLLIPALLPTNTTAHDFNTRDALVFEFDFSGFLPRHVLPALIVRRHEEIVGEMVWQNGVHLHSRHWQAEALLQADYHERKLTLWVRGEQASRYFTELYGELQSILGRMQELPFEEWVHLPKTAQIKPPRRALSKDLPARADFHDLLEKESAGEQEFSCKFGTYRLAEVLGIMPAAVRAKVSNGNTYFIGGDMATFDQRGQNVLNQQNIDGDLHQGDKVTMGDNFDFSGANISGNNNFNMKATLTNVSQNIGSLPNTNDEQKAQLEALLKELQTALQQVPAEKQEEAEAVGVMTQQTVDAAKSGNKTMLNISAKGLKEAAGALKDIAPAVASTVASVLGILVP